MLLQRSSPCYFATEQTQRLQTQQSFSQTSLVLSLYTSFLSFLIAEKPTECSRIKFFLKKKKRESWRKKERMKALRMFLNEGEKENKRMGG